MNARSVVSPVVPEFRRLSASAAACALWLAGPSAFAQAGAGDADLSTPNVVVVTGSLRAARAFDLPFAISTVDAEAIRSAGAMVNLSEAMARVPGLVVANRNNYAQDLQISSRGFGARAGFGVRGLRLYTDGIPATMPDGQGQLGHADLAGAQRIEVLRGPFSVLYGNSSGGVIAVFGAPATERRFEVGVDTGRFGLAQWRASLATPLDGGFDLKASVSSMETDGFHPQSAAERQLANLRLGWQGAADKVVLLFSHQEQAAQDPLGLRPEDWAANPFSTVNLALGGYDPAKPTDLLYDTRKTIRQTQAGLNWRHAFASAGALRDSSVSVYSGARSVVQYLAIPPTTQRGTNPAVLTWQRHGGGVVDFDRRFDGTEARLRFGWDGVEVVAGVALERMRDERFGYENFIGSPTAPTALGVVGDQRRNETNQATSRDAYLQADWALTPALTASAGLRSGKLDIRVTDRYVKGLNGDDSAALNFDYTNPVLGLRWRVSPNWSLHASAARGFESPTLGELAYPATSNGLNIKLQGQTSRQFEIGSKWHAGTLDFDAALFQTRTDNEIGVFTNSGGRATYQNVGRTRRQGAELSAQWRPNTAWRAQAALSVLDASYLDGYLTCEAAPCTKPTVPVAAGNRIAGTQRQSAYAELAWRPGVLPGELAVEARAQARTAANDTNADFAPGFGVVNLRWSHDWAIGAGGKLQSLLRLDNVADRAYVGSVIVNDGNRRLFEPAMPRAWLLSLRYSRGF